MRRSRSAPAAILPILLAIACSTPTGPQDLPSSLQGIWASPSSFGDLTVRENVITLEISHEGAVSGRGSLELYRSWDTGWERHRVDARLQGLALENGDLRLSCSWEWAYRGNILLVAVQDTAAGRTVIDGRLSGQVALEWPDEGPQVIRGSSWILRP